MGREGRFANFVLGIWVVISAFIWHHNAALFTITWITGIAIAFVALISMGAPQARFLNVLLGAWLIVSALAFRPAAAGTVWNNVIVGIIVAAVALAGASTGLPRRQARVPS